MKIFTWIIVVSILFSSCKKWLDVRPESQIEKDELFQTESGFQEALNGVYTNCTDFNSYGVQLTFAMPDVLAQNYSIAPQDYLNYLQF